MSWAVITTASPSVLAAPGTDGAPFPDSNESEVSDPALLEVLAEAAPSDRVIVEVLTDDVSAVRADARALGGVVVGTVPGEVVQVSLAAAAVDDLAGSPEAAMVRRPLIANRPVSEPLTPIRTEQASQIEFGPIAGENIGITNAQAWHDAGIRGAGVRIGIVDFFDMRLWNTAEHGPYPTGRQFCLDTTGSGFCPIGGTSDQEHGIAVAEIVRDMAPDAELWLATVASASDLRSAIDWFAANGVSIMTRSLGAAYDGPGDGTGPLGAVVDYAATKGITWFNSGGNDADGSYGRYTEGTDALGYVDFLAGPGVDTELTVFGRDVGLDGIRWSDWYDSPADVTDYRIEIQTPIGPRFYDAAQFTGAPPLEAADAFLPGPITIRIRRVRGAVEATPDVVEVGLFAGRLEYSQAPFSAAKPVVDSRNPSLVAVGAIDPAAGSSVGSYSSQGPTNDGRTKPDITGPSCIRSSIYQPCFDGTSAASPTGAGFAALLLGRGLAAGGPHLAALVRHLVTDLGVPGPDNTFGHGRITLPGYLPTVVDNRPALFTALTTPQRLLDTRATSPTPGARIGPHPPFTVIDLQLPVGGASAVALGIVSTDTTTPGYVQVVPTLAASLGTSSTLNVATPGQVQPNFAIVPVGANNSVTLYLFAGGNVVVDLLGTFGVAPAGPVTSGRFVAVDPVRILDTRPESDGPVPTGWVPHRPLAGESVRVTRIPAGASAAVVNVVADQAAGSGFLRAQATGATGLATSNGNFVAGLASGSLAIVPVGADGSITILGSNSTHLIVDLMGFVTGPSSPPGRDGLFVPLNPFRLYDSRAGAGIHGAGTSRLVQVTGGPVPAGASAVSMNLTSDAAAAAGFLTVFPADRGLPLISNLNYPAIDPRANAGTVRLSASGGLNTFVNQTTHVIIDVNGYFTGPT